jgi:hypothetical protein
LRRAFLIGAEKSLWAKRAMEIRTEHGAIVAAKGAFGVRTELGDLTIAAPFVAIGLGHDSARSAMLGIGGEIDATVSRTTTRVGSLAAIGATRKCTTLAGTSGAAIPETARRKAILETAVGMLATGRTGCATGCGVDVPMSGNRNRAADDRSQERLDRRSPRSTVDGELPGNVVEAPLIHRICRLPSWCEVVDRTITVSVIADRVNQVEPIIV